MINKIIARYKQIRTERYLHQTYQCQYAFVGMGQHSLTNLYPVLHYLGVPLKYICVTSERKARLIERKFQGQKATISLDQILQDETVKGVFVAATPSAHFNIASQVLQSGKSLFIEKPPCKSLAELDTLIDLQQRYHSPVAMVGLQKCYAPAVQLLKKRLHKERLINYDYHYLTGAYPEGDAMLDLFIHPLHLVCHLFGDARILACHRVEEQSYILLLQHPHVVGTLELSTSYTWTDAEESLRLCTKAGVYHLNGMEELTFSHKSKTVFSVPLEKLHTSKSTSEYLYSQNHFSPILFHHQIYTDGYFSELLAFVSAVEGKGGDLPTDLLSLRGAYRLLLFPTDGIGRSFDADEE